MPKAGTFELEGRSVTEFLKGFRSESTKESYAKKLRYFLTWARIAPDEFLVRTRKNPKWAEHLIIDYIEARRNEVSGSTIHQVRDALKHFYEMNDVENGINWPKIVRMMPRAKKIGADRAPTLDEVRKVIENSDTRMKCIILLLCSSGIRVGAFDYLTWKDVDPIQEDGAVVAAHLTVYRGDSEQYQTFITPECNDALVEYRRRREAVGEKIVPASPLIRDNWDSNPYRERTRQNPSIPVPLSSKAIRNEIGTLLTEIGLRDGGRKHEFKQVHGFRKFFKTQAERVMKTIDVEKLLGHTENYYKPSYDYLLEEYRGAIPHLTINESSFLKDELRKRTDESDKKMGELERANIILETKVEEMGRKIDEVTAYLTTSKGKPSA
ncbi:MAG: site-specific integrase [Nitrososphaerales archaeon]|jgi:integrase